MKHSVLRRSIVGVGAASVIGAMIAAPAGAAPVKAHKVTICHRTNSITNPYTKITVDESSADGSGTAKGQGDHYINHVGEVWTQETPKHAEWGDIIPPIPGVHSGLNWTAQGQAIWAAGCDPSAVLVATSDTDEDGDKIPNATDPDDDGDNVPDVVDPDLDDDGIPNVVDPDVDGDDVPNASDPDVDDDGTPDAQDPDDDNDGIPDAQDPTPEGTTDGDVPPSNPDSDNDGTPDSTDSDDDNDGTPDTRDADINDDGVPETDEQVIPRLEQIIPDQITDSVTQLNTSRLVTNTGLQAAVAVSCTPVGTRSRPAGDVAVKCSLKQQKHRALLRVAHPEHTRVMLTISSGARATYKPYSERIIITPH